MADHIFRAAVLDEANRPISSVWQFLSHREEVDITTVELSGQFKASLHSSGLYRIGFTTQEESDLFRAPGLDKAVHKWSPVPLGDSGARVSFQAVIPALGLGTNCDYHADTDVCRLPRPEHDQALLLSFIEEAAAGAADRYMHAGAKVLHRWSTVGGRHLGVATQLYSPTAAELAQWRVLIASSEDFNRGLGRCVDERGGYEHRGVWPLQSGEGMFRVFELGLGQAAMWATFAG